MYAHAAARFVAPENTAITRVDSPLGVVRDRRDDVNVIPARRQPLRGIGDEWRNAGRLRCVVRRPDQDAAHAGTATFCSCGGPGTSRIVRRRTSSAGLPA